METLQKKIKKIYTARAELEAGLGNFFSDINTPIDKPDRKFKTECLIVKCKDAFTNICYMNEELFDLAHKTEDPDTIARAMVKTWSNG